MSEAVWLPGLVVLAAGLAVGLVAAYRLRARGAGRRGGRHDPELELQLADLEARRDELYRRLREEELSEGDRRVVEDEAARTLMRLDRLGPARPASKGKGKPEPAGAEPPPAAAAAASAAAPAAAAGYRHPLLVGFVFGAGLVVLVGLLVYFAVRDAQPRADDPVAAAPAGDEPHEGEAALPPELRQELTRLEQQAAANPGDLLALKRLALARLDAGLYFDAYRDAEAILASRAEDPDGLFIQGVVRVTMGQNEPAVELLDRVLARFPEHLQAMIYRGLALAQAGSVDQALDTWEIALDMAGGRHPELERLIQMAREPQGGALPGPQAAAPPAAAPPATPPAAGPGPTPAGPAYRATVTLAPGARPPGGAVLFFSLLPAGGGPPVAVQRIESPRFPLELELDQRHSMMGAELPGEGVLVARLDADGSASTRGPGDLEARSEASAGARLSLVLSGGG